MADPVTMAVVGIGAQAAGAGVGAIGSLFSGGAQANEANYRAGIARIQQKINLENADYARYTGEIDAQESGMKTRAQVGETLALQGASGLDVSSGSAAKTRASELEIGTYDQAVIRANAARRAYGYEVQAVGDEAQANLDMMAASTSKTAGVLGAISSVIGGAAGVSSKVVQGRQIGLF